MTGRPLFRDESSFRALYAQRLGSYQLADFRVDSSGDPSTVVTEILQRGLTGISSNLSEIDFAAKKPQP